MTRNRRGFTLIEALIAITVLLMLSAVTIFSTLNMIASAEANNVITNMMHIKTAVLMWYKDNSSRVTNSHQIKTGTTTQTLSNFFKDHGDEILKYLDKKPAINIRHTEGDTGDYSLLSENSNNAQWYVRYKLGKIENTSDMEAPNMRIREKLAGNAKTYGLSGKNNGGTLNSFYTNEQFAYMLIIDFNK